MPVVYVFAASKMEARGLVRPASLTSTAHRRLPVGSGDQGTNRIVLTITGMGPANAQSKAETAFKPIETGANGPPSSLTKPDAVLIIGVCGALTEGLPEQSVVIYEECLSTDPDKRTPAPCAPVLASAIVERLRSRGIACDPVIGITSSRIASTKSEKLALARLGASVVDMESYEVLSAAERAGAPAAVLRVVSDSLDVSMPDFNGALGADGGLDKFKALWIALGSPLKMLRLLAVNKRALKRLSVAVKLTLESDSFPT
jgi:uridine phosphorylase